MATALKLRLDIKKLKAAINSKATPKSFLTKLRSQLEKSEKELETIKKTGKPPKQTASTGNQQTLTALQKLIEKKKYKVYQGKGVDLKKDAQQPAKATGRRVSKGLKSNQFGDKKSNKGNVYYEYRPNRLDVKQPPKRYPKLEKGGLMDKINAIKDKYAKGGYVAVSEKDGYWTIISKPTTKEKAQEVIKMGGLPRGEVGKVVTIAQAKSHKKLIGEEYLADGGMMAKGGKTKYGNKKVNYKGFEIIQHDGHCEIKGYSGMSGTFFQSGDIETIEQAKEVIDLALNEKNIPNIKDIHKRIVHYSDNRYNKNLPQDYADGGMMARGGKLEVGDEVMVDDSGYVKLFTEFDISKPAKIISKGKTKSYGKVVYFYGLETADGKKPYNNAPEWKLTKVSSDGGYMAKGGTIEMGDMVHISAINKSGVVTNVISQGKHYTVRFPDGSKMVYDKKELEKVNEDELTGEREGERRAGMDDEYLAKGGFVSKGELVWKKLSSSKKSEFLYQNFTPQITPRSQEILVGKDFNFLPKDVKIKLEQKYADVEDYANGGEVKSKYKVGDMVYSYQNKDYAAPINYIRFVQWDSNKGSHPKDKYIYRLSLKDGNSNWNNEESLHKSKQKEYAHGGYMAKGGGISSQTTYVPNRDVSELSVILNKQLKTIKGTDIVDGIYVKNSALSKLKARVAAKKSAAPKITAGVDDIYAKMVAKAKEYKIEAKYIKENLKKENVKSLVDAGLDLKDLFIIYFGIQTLSPTTDLSYDSSGIMSLDADYVNRSVDRIIYAVKGNKFEIGLKYPHINWSSIIKKYSIQKEPATIKGEVSVYKNEKENYVYAIYKGKNVVIGTTIDRERYIDGKLDKDDYYKIDAPTDGKFEGGYWGLVTSSKEIMYDIAKMILSQNNGYVKDIELFTNGLGGVRSESLDLNNVEYERGGSMDGGQDNFKKFNLNDEGEFAAKIDGKDYVIKYRDDVTQLYDLYENGKLKQSNTSIRKVMYFANGGYMEGGGNLPIENSGLVGKSITIKLPNSVNEIKDVVVLEYQNDIVGKKGIWSKKYVVNKKEHGGYMANGGELHRIHGGE